MRNVSKNVGFSIINNVIVLILSFVVRRFFILQLGTDYVGLNSLFSNILGILSFTELGIGVAVTASLYEPLQRGNLKLIRAYLHFYRKFLNAVALIIILAAATVGFFIPTFIHGSSIFTGFQLWIYFFLYSLSSAVTYLITYKRIILTADQNDYLNQVNNLIFQSIIAILQIVVLVLWKNYLLYLIIQVVFVVVSNFTINHRINKRYPELFKKKLVEKLDKKTLHELRKSITGMISAKVGGIVLTSTDNIVISAFLGLTILGKYSNYVMIVTGLTVVLNQLITALTPSIGNFRFSDDFVNNKQETKLFYQVTGMNYLIVIFACCGFAVFSSLFIQVWVGKQFILDFAIVACLIISFGVNQFRQAILAFETAYGLFWQQRYKAVLEAALNIVLSILLIKYTNLGVIGVLTGTMFTNLTLNLIWEILIIKSNALTHIKLSRYFIQYFITLIFLICSTIFGIFISNILLNNISAIFAFPLLLIVFLFLCALNFGVFSIIFPDGYQFVKSRLIRQR